MLKNKYGYDVGKSKHHIIKIWKVFYLMYWDGGWWFRFFTKWGMSGWNIKKSIELFSERNGYIKYIQIGNWRISFIK